MSCYADEGNERGIRLAIEPTNGRPDALDITAGQWHSAGKPKARQKLSWDRGILVPYTKVLLITSVQTGGSHSLGF